MSGRTASDGPETLHAFLSQQASRTPERTAAVCGDRRLSYGALNARANQLAHLLRERGVGPEARVAVAMGRSLDLLVAIFGVLKAGGAYVPLDPSHPAERLRWLLDDCQPQAVIADASVVDHDGAVVRLPWPYNMPDRYSDADPQDTASGDHLACAIYTSGSTGQPKAALVEHRSLINCLQALAQPELDTSDDVHIFQMNPAFDAAGVELYAPLVRGRGGCLAVVSAGDERDPTKLLRELQRHKATHLVMVPAALQALLGNWAPDTLAILARLQSLDLGGEAISRGLAERLCKALPHTCIRNLYGPTEAAIAVTGFDLREPFEGEAAPIGRPIANVALHVLDEQLQPVAMGELGELYIGGIAVARGYWRRPELTATCFLPDPWRPGGRLYKTGDLGRWTASGNLVYAGRRDRQIKLRGYRIELGEIERQLAAHPEIADMAVLATPRGAGEARLAAFWVARNPGAAPDPGALRQFLRDKLPAYMVPTVWRTVASLPVTPNGKRDYDALAAAVATAPAAPNPGASHASKADAIAMAWAAELDATEFSGEDDFFDLGGHSLSAARVTAALRDALQRDITPGDLYRASRFGAYRQLVGQAPPLVGVKLVAPEPKGWFPLAYQQLDCWLLEKGKAPNLNLVNRRRVAGAVNPEQLQAALVRVIAEHPVLRYRYAGRWPQQRVGAAEGIPVEIRDSGDLAVEQQEETVLQSIVELMEHGSWQPDQPRMRVRLLRMGSDLSEIQICLPHMSSDEITFDILWDDLSRYYLDSKATPATPAASYAGYIGEQRRELSGRLPQHRTFWETYLEGTAALCFPEAEVMPLEEAESEYILWPEEEITAVREAARREKVSLPDWLHAMALLAVAPYVTPSPDDNKKLAYTTPRSERASAVYDRVIGPLARLDCLKVDLAGAADVGTLAHRVSAAKRLTEPYQSCPAAVKSASLYKPRWSGSAIRDTMRRLAAHGICMGLRRAQLQYEIMLAEARMISLIRRPSLDFTLVVNVLHSFLAPAAGSAFGYPLAEVRRLPSMQPPVARVLEVYFLREPHNQNQGLIMLNGDLRPQLRRQLAAAIRETMRSLPLLTMAAPSSAREC